MIAVCLLAATAFVFSLGRLSAFRKTDTTQELKSEEVHVPETQPSVSPASIQPTLSESNTDVHSEPAVTQPSASSAAHTAEDRTPAAEEPTAVASEASKPWLHPSIHVSSRFSEELQPFDVAGTQVWAPSPHVLALDGAAGVVLLLHGCSHTAEVWATGAEERPVVQQLLSARLWPIAVTSWSSRGGDGAPGGCWDSFTPMSENENVKTIIATVTAVARRWGVVRAARAGPGPAGQPSHHMARLPMYAIGASSGAGFLSVVATVVQFRAAGLYIMPPAKDAIMMLATGGKGRLQALDGGGGVENPDRGGLGLHGLPAALQARFYPASFFLHMPRDAQTAQYTRKAIEWMRMEAGMPASAVLEYELLPRRLHKRTFSQAIPSLVTEKASMKLFFMLEDAKLLTRDASQGRGGLDGPRRLSHPVIPTSNGDGRNWSTLDDDLADGQWLAVDPRHSEAVELLLTRFCERTAGPHDMVEGEGQHAHTHDVFDVPLGLADAGSSHGLSPEAVLELAVRSSRGFEDSAPPDSGAARPGAGAGVHPLDETDAHTAARTILRRNLAEVLNERYAAHEMSAQGRRGLVDFFVRHAEWGVLASHGVAGVA